MCFVFVFLVFIIVHKISIYTIWTVDWTKYHIQNCHGLWEHVLGFIETLLIFYRWQNQFGNQENS